ncbi:MAG: glycosyltransferase [Opitutales bacterium]
MKSPTLTVAIPTRERADLLAFALRTVLRQPSPRLTILVSDNASRDGTAALVRGVRDPRVRYINTGERLSMSHHYDFVLRHIDTDYVLYLGDDDGLLPQATTRIQQLIEKYQSPAAITTSEAYFIWQQNAFAGNPGTVIPGELFFPVGPHEEWRDGLEELRKFAQFEHSNPGHDLHDLPCVYWGVVRTELLHRLQKTGSFFLSKFPDVYSGVALAATCGQYVFCRQPFVLPGTSPKSTGVDLFLQPAASAANPYANLFFAEGGIPWHPAVPPCASCDSLFKWDAFLRAQDAGLIPASITWNMAAMLRVAVAELSAKSGPRVEADWETLKQWARQNGLTLPPEPPPQAPRDPVPPVRYFWPWQMLQGRCPSSVQTIDDAVLFVQRFLRWEFFRRVGEYFLRLAGRFQRLRSRLRARFSTSPAGTAA